MSAPVAVCSNRPRPAVQSQHTPGGGHWWRRDVYHLQARDGRTLCGRSCADWLTIGPMPTLTADCCKRCFELNGGAGNV